MPRPAPVSFADVLDELRSAVESDGRSTAAIAAGLDPPMSRSQLAQILTGVKRALVDRDGRPDRRRRATAAAGRTDPVRSVGPIIPPAGIAAGPPVCEPRPRAACCDRGFTSPADLDEIGRVRYDPAAAFRASDAAPPLPGPTERGEDETHLAGLGFSPAAMDTIGPRTAGHPPALFT